MIKRYLFLILLFSSFSFIFAQTCVPYTCETYPGVCGNNLNDSCGGTIDCVCTQCNDGIDNDNDGGFDSLVEETYIDGGALGAYVSHFDDFSVNPFGYTINFPSYRYWYFSNDSNYHFYASNGGTCYYEPGVVRLSSGRTWSRCHLYYDAHNFSSSKPWSVSFDFILGYGSDGCADGFEIIAESYDDDGTFVRNIAAEVDIYKNPASYGDISNHHMSVMNGSRAIEYSNAKHIDPTNQDIHCSNFKADNYEKSKNVRLEYDGNGKFTQYLDDIVVSTGQFNVDFDYSRIVIPAITGAESFSLYIDNLTIEGYDPNAESQPKLTSCNDGIDNDNDGNIDLNDDGCDSLNDTSELEHDNECTLPTTLYESLPVCDNNLDDDSDGKIDENDPGCWLNISDPNSYDPDHPTEVEIIINEPLDTYWANFLSNEALPSGTDVHVGDYVKIVSESGSPYKVFRNSDEYVINDSVKSNFWIAEAGDGYAGINFSSNEKSSNNLIDVVNSIEDSPMNVQVVSPSCGKIIDLNDVYPITINAFDEDDIIYGEVIINGETVYNFNNLNDPISEINYTFDKSGNTKIIVKTTNTRGENFVNILNVIVVDYSSTTRDYYVASCIDEPKNFDRFQSSRIKFNASSSTGAIFYGDINQTLEIVDNKNLMYHWDFYNQNRYLGSCIGKGDKFCNNENSVEGMTVIHFIRGFETVNDNYITLSVSFPDDLI